MIFDDPENYLYNADSRVESLSTISRNPAYPLCVESSYLCYAINVRDNFWKKDLETKINPSDQASDNMPLPQVKDNMLKESL